MKKVLLIGNSELIIFGFRKELIEALVKEGHEVFVCFPKTEFGDGKQTADKFGCTYIPIEISSHGTDPFTDLKLISSFKKIMRNVMPDVVFTYTIKPNIYGGMAAAKCGIPCVMNVSGLGTAVENPGILQKITVALYRIATKKAQKVFFQNSENEAFFATRNLANGKRALLPGSGVNLDNFKVLPYPQDEVHFLFMARIMKEKGIEQYLEAACVIREKYPNTMFHVLGVCTNDQYNAQLKDLEIKGIITYHGHQSDVRPFHAISSCTIHPTYYPEGMSNVLLESSACGRPIITTNRSGCREIIDDGVNGFIVNAEDTADLIEKIERFLSLSFDQRRNMGLAGRAKVEREFDRKFVVNAYINEIPH